MIRVTNAENAVEDRMDWRKAEYASGLVCRNALVSMINIGGSTII
jgi:hypothetical protein